MHGRIFLVSYYHIQHNICHLNLVLLFLDLGEGGVKNGKNGQKWIKILKDNMYSQFADRCIYQLSIPFHSIFLSSNSRHFNLLNSGLWCLLN